MRVFLAGITGTLGSALAHLHHTRGDQVFGCSRNEVAAVAWRVFHPDLAAGLLVADAACLADPKTDVSRLLPTMDRVYHLAALKHVDVCERHPDEAYRQNVELTTIVSAACASAGVPLVFASSDKACLPQGVYGATKLLAERVVLARAGAVVRLGNLIGSSGSVFQLWRDAVARGERIKLTDPEMTRYFIPVEEAAAFMADRAVAGCVATPYPMRAARMGDVAEMIAGRSKVDVIGRRDGETQHQWLIAPGEGMTRGVGCVLLGGWDKWSAGVSSESSSRWCPRELLEAAGVRG